MNCELKINAKLFDCMKSFILFLYSLVSQMTGSLKSKPELLMFALET